MNTLNLAKTVENYMIEMRRHFHENPELSAVEFNTLKRIGEELEKMGIRVSVDGTVATIDGGAPIKAAKLRATDLRAGASMIIAALAGEGTSEICELRHIDRGYEHIVEKLRGIGADIERVDD